MYITLRKMYVRILMYDRYVYVYIHIYIYIYDMHMLVDTFIHA